MAYGGRQEVTQQAQMPRIVLMRDPQGRRVQMAVVEDQGIPGHYQPVGVAHPVVLHDQDADEDVGGLMLRCAIQ